ncbi:MAG: hypothetical protein ACI8TQ_001275 [Planctomycetota bacterium]|jgi:hypothetical protein
MKSITIVLLIAFLASAIVHAEGPLFAFQEIDSPAGPGSGEPRLYVDQRGSLYLSWVEESEGTSSLWVATFDEMSQSFARKEKIASGENWFVNWADTPGFCVSDSGARLAYWLQKTGAGAYDYEIRFSVWTVVSGKWSEPARLHDDDDLGEHGFVSAAPFEDRFALTWLKVSPSESGSTNASLRYRELRPSGALLPEITLDESVCTCCSTSMIRTDDGELWATYRDRSKSEIRDISFVRYSKSSWSQPTTVFDDRWKMPGCPVNGPVLASQHSELAATWYTGAGEGGGRVNLAFRNGERFGFPLRIDDGRPEGRPHLAMTPHGQTLVIWLEVGDDGAEWRLKRVTGSGIGTGSPVRSLSPSSKLVSVPQSRSSGFAQIAQTGKHTVFAWTEPGTPAQVRTAVLKLRE